MAEGGGTAESQQIIEARRFGAQVDERRWDGGVRIVLQGSMRAVFERGMVDLKDGWRADVFYGKGRKPAFVMVADSAPAVLRDLAALLTVRADEE